MDLRLLSLYCTFLLATTIQSLIIPFLPPLALSQGLSPQMSGIIISMQPLISILIANCYVYILKRTTRKFSLTLAVTSLISSVYLFSILPYFTEAAFFLLALVSQFLLAIGATGNAVTSTAIVAAKYKEEMERVLGIR